MKFKPGDKVIYIGSQSIHIRGYTSTCLRYNLADPTYPHIEVILPWKGPGDFPILRDEPPGVFEANIDLVPTQGIL